MREDIVSWAVRTHRILASSAEFYRGKLSADPRGTTALLRTLHAVGPDVAALLPGNRPMTAATTYRAAARFPIGDAYRPNPLVDDLRRTHPALYALASAEGPPPAMFGAGDLPSFTSSGIDPGVLAGIPWTARHAAAAAPTTAAAYAIIEEVSGPDGDVEAARYAGHGACRDYQSRVRSWAIGSIGRPSAEPLTADYDDLFPPGRPGGD